MMRWVVLSDIHFALKENFTTSELRKKLLLFLENDRKENGSFDFVLITGDCMYQFKDSGCAEYLSEVMQACDIDREHIFLTPGNHDVYRRDKERNDIIDKARRDTLESYPQFDDEMMGYDRFNKLYYMIKEEEYRHFSVFESSEEDTNRYRIINIDSCLLSKDDNDDKQLRVCFPELEKIENDILNDDCINIVIMHHGYQWLHPQDGKVFQHWLADHFIDIVFCGHEHEAGECALDEAGLSLKQFTCGCGIFEHDIVPSFYVCEYDNFGSNNIRVKLHTFQGKGEWDIDPTILKSFPRGINDYEISRREDLVLKTTDLQSNTEILQGLKISKVYKNLMAARDEIAEDIKKSSFFKFFGLRGATFVGGDEINPIAQAIKETKNLSICFLVSYPFCEQVRHRLGDLPECRNDDDFENKWRDLFDKSQALKKEYKDNINVELRFHKEELVFRLFITERYIYMNYYEVQKNCSESELYRFDNYTSTYKTYNNYFDCLWKSAKRSVPKKIPAKYSFVKERFNVVPSLVINVSGDCNMKCQYCPKGGENLCEIEKSDYCSEVDLQKVVNSFGEHVIKDREKPIIRITGGEPLFDEATRKRTACILSAAKKYSRIVLCTNAVYFKQAYEENNKVWDNVKNQLLIKISLDTLDNRCFSEITGVDKLKEVKENIIFAKSKGFNIELNTVASSLNIHTVDDILEIFEFAQIHKLIGVKILTVNDFGGAVDFEQTEEEKQYISKILQEVIRIMREKGIQEKQIYLNDNKGIKMQRFISVFENDETCTLTIVDHNNAVNSITPRRTFSDFCISCDYYPDSDAVKSGKVSPCATGIMSLNLRADGLLNPCRLRIDNGIKISGLSGGKIKRAVDDKLKTFDRCFHKTISELNK